MISSPGGNINAAFAIFNFLQTVTPGIVCVNTSGIDSSSNVVFQSGARRIACPNSTFLFHGLSWTFGASTLARSAIQEAATQLMMRIGSWECSPLEAGLLRRRFEAGFATGEALTAQAALEKGVVDEVASPAPAAGDIVAAL